MEKNEIKSNINLAICPQCKSKISPSAKICIHCGHPKPNKLKGLYRTPYIILILLTFVCLAMPAVVLREAALGTENPFRARELTDLSKILYFAATALTIFFTSFRLKNAGQSVWLSLLVILPIMNIIIVLYAFFTPPRSSEEFKKQYG